MEQCRTAETTHALLRCLQYPWVQILHDWLCTVSPKGYMEDFRQSSGKTETDSQIRTWLLQMKRVVLKQEPITRSFHLPYWPSESTLSRISEAPPTWVFADVFIIANREEAVILYCYKSNAATRKYFNYGGRRRYHSSKNKKIRDRVDSSVQFGWRLRVMGSCS